MAFIKEYLLKKLIDESISVLKNIFKKNSIEVIVKKKDLEFALDSHLNYVENLTKQIGFKEMLSSRALKKLYIILDIQLSPKKLLPLGFKKKLFKIEELILNDNHLIILGDPGAGKTTSIKNLAQKLLHEDDKYLKDYSFPLLVQLRDLGDDESLFSRISDIIGINLFYKFNGRSTPLESQILEKDSNKIMICDYLDRLRPVILIDGLDEINELKQDKIIKEIRILCNNLSQAKVLVTCRSGAFDIHLDNTEIFEICSLNDIQIDYFISKWFDNIKAASDFKKELYESTFKDLAIRPLTLSHLCALYEKYYRLPERPKYIYKKLITLLLEEWDSQRAIIRESKYYNFETERKYEFLANLAFQLTLDSDRKRFSEEELLNTLNKFHTVFNIDRKDLISVINEIESHNGIFVKSSYDSYEFSHKSMQEYLSADHLIRKGSIPFGIISKKNFSNELAIAVSLSSTPNNDYFYRLVYGFFLKNSIAPRYFNEFFFRLSIEKPDFSNDVFLSFTIYFLFHHYYSLFNSEENKPSKSKDRDVDSNSDINSNEDIEKEPISIKSQFFASDFDKIFNNLIQAPNVAGSFRSLNKIVKYSNLDYQYVFFQTRNVLKHKPDILEEVGYFKFPELIRVKKKFILKFS